jgi:glycosyltransferase involved in cell wall biosynthesis
MRDETLHICMYTPTADGGHALYTRELLTAIAELGPARRVAAELVTCVDLAAENRTDLYPIHAVLPPLVHRSTYRTRLGWAGSRVVYFAKRERAFLDWIAHRSDIDVVHFQEYTAWHAPWDWPRLRRRSIALLYTVHNVFLHHYHNQIFKTIRDSSFRRAWRDCDALIVHSEGLREALADFLGRRHPPIHVTPHGVWSRIGQPEPLPEPRKSSRPRLLFFGVIRPNKGLHVLLRAMERLPTCDLTVAGAPEDPGYHARVRDLVGRLPPDRVEMIDHYVDESDVPAIFTRSQLVVLPYTTFASQSGVLHQALAYGVPVVATDVGAMGECVRQWGIGSVVPPGDPDALAEAIEQTLQPRNYSQAIAAIARIRVELTWARMAQATIDVYESIAR